MRHCTVIFTLFAWLFLSDNAIAEPSKTQQKAKILFVLYEAGDSYALQPVMEELDNMAVNYRILAFGKGRELFSQHPRYVAIDEDISKDRSIPLSSKALDDIMATVDARIVVSGMSSKGQAQIMNRFREREQKTITIAYYDNFEPVHLKPYVKPFLDTLIKTDFFFVPSTVTGQSFSNIRHSKNSKVLVLGQPTLEKWVNDFEVTDSDAVRKRLGLKKDDKIILFSGGYDLTYKKNFDVFVQGMKLMPDIKAVVTYHPKMDGSIERSAIKKYGAKNIKIIDDEIPSILATVSDAVATHKSSVGVQALYMGLPVVFIADTEKYSNFAIRQGLARQVDTPKDFAEAVKAVFDSQTRKRDLTVYLGIPRRSPTKTAQYLVRLSNELSHCF